MTIPHVNEDAEQLVKMQNDTVTVEHSLAIKYEVKHTSITRPNYCTPKYLL